MTKTQFSNPKNSPSLDINDVLPFHETSQVEIGYIDVLSCFTRETLKDIRNDAKPISDPETHLDMAIQWLKKAHDMGGDGGVSWGYSLRGKWRGCYRETSGYIAETFFDLASFRGDQDAFKRAIEISHWLTNIQDAEGGVTNTRYSSKGIVFDTGQVLQGLVKAYQETQQPKFLSAAERAADWLVRVADDQSIWTQNTHNGIPHVYNARVAWILLQLNSISPTAGRRQIAEANLDWAISQQQPSGLFDQCAFVPEVAPFTHTIAYAIRGILEAGLLLESSRYLEAAIKASKAVLAQVHEDGFLPGQLDISGNPVGKYCCLTGNCQMAIIWLKLFEITRDRQYFTAAEKCLSYVRSRQDIVSNDLNIRGAIKGSYPIWGKYTRLSYPNWAAKFFIDAMLLLSRQNENAF